MPSSNTGVLVAAADRSDPHHEQCAALVMKAAGQMRTTAMVIAEAAYLLGRKLGPNVERLLYDSIIAGDIVVEHLGIADWKRTATTASYDSDTPTRSPSPREFGPTNRSCHKRAMHEGTRGTHMGNTRSFGNIRKLPTGDAAGGAWQTRVGDRCE